MNVEGKYWDTSVNTYVRHVFASFIPSTNRASPTYSGPPASSARPSRP